MVGNCVSIFNREASLFNIQVIYNHMGIADDFKRRIEYDVENTVWSGIKKTGSQLAKKGGKCPKCKKPLPQSAVKFCPSCGFALTAACPKCGAAAAPGTKFCASCGSKL